MKNEDLDDFASSSIEDLGSDIARRAVFGDTKNIGKDACKQAFGEGIIGSIGYIAVNILTGGSLSLLKWLGPAEKIGNSLGKKSDARTKRKRDKWEKEFDDLTSRFMALVKQLHRKDISESERNRLSKEIDKVEKRQSRLVTKKGF